MGRVTRMLVYSAVLGAMLPASRGNAQTPTRPGAPPTQASRRTDPSDDLLPGLPRPADEPGSLLRPAPAVPAYSCDPLPGPYFERDPRLDPPELPQPGWFGDAEVGIVGPHIKNRLVDTIQVGNLSPSTVHLPSAELGWTGSPRFEVGYRLPSGWGAIGLSYRFLFTDGNETMAGPDGPASLKSRLDVHIADLDYISRELSLWPHWGMRWRFGVRFASVYFDSQSTEPFAEAAAGSGISAARTTNYSWGLGPHYGVELERQLGWEGLALVGSIDSAFLMGRTRQGFFETTTTLGPGGQPLAGEDHIKNPQTYPVLKLQVGLSWEPPGMAHSHFFLGYEYEYWWNVARISTSTSRGEISDQGIVLRAAFNF